MAVRFAVVLGGAGARGLPFGMRAGSGQPAQVLGRALSSTADDVVLAARDGPVSVLTLNRPKAMNALNAEVAARLMELVRANDADEAVAATVLTGGEKAFAAGADIKQMATMTGSEWRTVDPDTTLLAMNGVANARKPIIAAVNGFCLGGGCELAMMCDIMIAGTKARFGQPEVTLGVLPGAGGTQRLTGIVGKSKAMQMCLTGDMIGAEEAKAIGLVSEVHEPAEVLPRAVAIAKRIAEHSQLAVAINKDAINRSLELSLSEGLNYERQLFYSLFDSQDQKEGMDAFKNKRKPQWKNC